MQQGIYGVLVCVWIQHCFDVDTTFYERVQRSGRVYRVALIDVT